MAYIQTISKPEQCDKCGCYFYQKENRYFGEHISYKVSKRVHPVYFENRVLCSACFSKLINDKI